MKENERTGQEEASEKTLPQENLPEGGSKARKLPAGIALRAGVAVLLLVVAVLAAIWGAHSDGAAEVNEEPIWRGDQQHVLTQDPERQDTYVVGVAQLPIKYHSYLQTMEGALVINDLVYPGLAAKKDGQYHYLLAQEITFSDDGRSASIQLDPQACSSDGCQLTADDILYSWKYLASSEIGYDWQEILLHVASVEKVSDTELTVTFVSASVDNFTAFTVPVLHPQNHEYDTISKDTTHIGFGTYRIESLKLQAEAVLVRNEHAAEAGAYSTVKVVPADLTRLERQEIDTMIIAADLCEEVKTWGSYDIYRECSGDGGFLLFNTEEPQMRDVENRVKLAEALNRTDLVSLIFGDGVLSHGVTAGDKRGVSYETLANKDQSADGLNVTLANVFSGQKEADLFTEVCVQLDAAGASITSSNTNPSLSYYYGRVEGLLGRCDLTDFYEGLNGKTLAEVGDLLEENLVEHMYAIPLHNEVYYTVNLCGKERIDLLGDLY